MGWDARDVIDSTACRGRCHAVDGNDAAECHSSGDYRDGSGKGDALMLVVEVMIIVSVVMVVWVAVIVTRRL